MSADNRHDAADRQRELDAHLSFVLKGLLTADDAAACLASLVSGIGAILACYQSAEERTAVLQRVIVQVASALDAALITVAELQTRVTIAKAAHQQEIPDGPR